MILLKFIHKYSIFYINSNSRYSNIRYHKKNIGILFVPNKEWYLILGEAICFHFWNKPNTNV